MNLYCEAKFMRGSGIGTRLFPWARCVLFSEKNNAYMLRPNWVQPRIGPLIRGGIDYKSYARQILLYNLFNKPVNSTYVIDDLFARVFYDKITENEYVKYSGSKKGLVVRFEGDSGRFKSLNGYDEKLKEELIKITKNEWIQFVDSFKNIPIGINIRLGNDFKSAQTIDDHYKSEFIKTPVSWFVESLKKIRHILGYDAAAYIVTDGTESDIVDLLDLPNTFFVRPGCAISDLLILSKSKILLRSGGSSFSAWASFLGQMPTISHPGQPMDKFNMINKNGYYTGEFVPNEHNEKLVEDLSNVFKLR